jgi:hypothetical protein
VRKGMKKKNRFF